MYIITTDFMLDYRKRYKNEVTISFFSPENIAVITAINLLLSSLKLGYYIQT